MPCGNSKIIMLRPTSSTPPIGIMRTVSSFNGGSTTRSTAFMSRTEGSLGGGVARIGRLFERGLACLRGPLPGAP